MVFFYILLFFFTVFTVRAFQTKSEGWTISSGISGAVVILAFFFAPFDKKSTYTRINLDSSLVIERNGVYFTLPAFFDRNKSCETVESKQKPTGVLIKHGASLAGIVVEKGYSVVFD